ncbi:MAG: hypothetical protein JRN21_09865 [Nitrososphaerota archaeon]|nr:hypothetical protein [Nitrososphaerota archaeon]
MSAIKEVLSFLRNIPESLDQAKANTYGIYSMSSRERARAAERLQAEASALGANSAASRERINVNER